MLNVQDLGAAGDAPGDAVGRQRGHCLTTPVATTSTTAFCAIPFPTPLPGGPSEGVGAARELLQHALAQDPRVREA